MDKKLDAWAEKLKLKERSKKFDEAGQSVIDRAARWWKGDKEEGQAGDAAAVPSTEDNSEPHTGTDATDAATADAVQAPAEEAVTGVADVSDSSEA